MSGESQKKSRNHDLPKCVPEWRFEILRLSAKGRENIQYKPRSDSMPEEVFILVYTRAARVDRVNLVDTHFRHSLTSGFWLRNKKPYI